MPSSSNNTIRFQKRPRDFILAISDNGGPGDSRRRRFDMKEVQRRAFERGVAVERERHATLIRDMVATVSEQSAQLSAALQADREKIESFAVQLALHIAEDLTRTLVDRSEYDVLAMVRDLIGELEDGPVQDQLILKLHPVDHAVLLEAAAGGEIHLDELEVVPDESLPKASPKLIGGDIQYFANLHDRMTQLRNRLTEESRHATP